MMTLLSEKTETVERFVLALFYCGPIGVPAGLMQNLS